MTPAMSDEIARLLIAIPDDVLQELTLNLDVSARAAVALCDAGDETAALGEWADAVAVAGLLYQRTEGLQ